MNPAYIWLRRLPGWPGPLETGIAFQIGTGRHVDPIAAALYDTPMRAWALQDITPGCEYELYQVDTSAVDVEDIDAADGTVARRYLTLPPESLIFVATREMPAPAAPITDPANLEV